MLFWQVNIISIHLNLGERMREKAVDTRTCHLELGIRLVVCWQIALSVEPPRALWSWNYKHSIHDKQWYLKALFFPKEKVHFFSMSVPAWLISSGTRKFFGWNWIYMCEITISKRCLCVQNFAGFTMCTLAPFEIIWKIYFLQIRFQMFNCPRDYRWWGFTVRSPCSHEPFLLRVVDLVCLRWFLGHREYFTSFLGSMLTHCLSKDWPHVSATEGVYVKSCQGQGLWFCLATPAFEKHGQFAPLSSNTLFQIWLIRTDSCFKWIDFYLRVKKLSSKRSWKQ